ncbi:MAG TPA: DNA polymerase III subunit delta' [Casimicrobiaceae bacterium]|nr:DNA polymerase III subunit delta' [Casimicrobiaceae bacterium]
MNGPDQDTTWQPLPPWQHAVVADMLAGRARWPHAVLIGGREGLGKRRLAMHLARALLCEAPGADGEACGACVSCRLVESRSHPDLRLVEPVTYDEEGNATKTDNIGVDRVRELTAFAQLSSHRRVAKVAVIVPAEALNAAAANALLKTLEEPPPATYLLLVSHQPGRLPATIVSRCRRLPVGEPEPAAANAWLAAHGVADPGAALARAGGAPLLALELAQPEAQQGLEALIADLSYPERLSAVAVGARLDAVPKDDRGAELAHLLYWMLTWATDLAAVASGGEPRFHPDRRQALFVLAARVARVPLFRYYQKLLHHRALLAHPLQPRLVAEALLLEYRSLFA